MPTVLRSNGFRVMIYRPPREHWPPHVHVTRGGGEVVIALSPVRVRYVSGMRDADIAAAMRLVERVREDLMQRWREIHDHEAIDPR